MMFGLYNVRQEIDMDWHWNGYVQELKPHGALLDVIAPDGDGDDARWPNGLWQRFRRLLRAALRCHLRYPGAVRAVLATRPGRLNLDASARYDHGSVFGSVAAGVQRTMDVNRRRRHLATRDPRVRGRQRPSQSGRL